MLLRRTAHSSARSLALRTALLALGSGLLVTFGSAMPAQADEVRLYELTTRPASLPTTEEAARRLSTARLVQQSGRDGTTVTADIVLEAEPTEADDAVLRVGFGIVDDTGECVATWVRAVSTYAPRGSGTEPEDLETSADRDGAAMSLRWVLSNEQESAILDAQCASARVVDPADGSVLDGLDGAKTGSFGFDPSYPAEIGAVTGRHVRPGRWSTLQITVRSQSDVRGFEVAVFGSGLKSRVFRTDQELAPGETFTAPVEVRLKGHKRTRRAFVSLDTYGSAFGPVDHKRVKLVLQGQRTRN